MPATTKISTDGTERREVGILQQKALIKSRTQEQTRAIDKNRKAIGFGDFLQPPALTRLQTLST